MKTKAYIQIATIALTLISIVTTVVYFYVQNMGSAHLISVLLK